MAVVLLLVSFVFGLAGAILANLAGFGPGMGVLGYVLGGMIGAVGVMATAARGGPPARHTTHPAPIAQSRHTSRA